MRDYDFYFRRAREKQGFKYNNQIEAALGFKGSMCSILKNGKKHLSEEKMIELCRLAGIDPAIGLLDLHMMKTDGETQKVYASLLQRCGVQDATMYIMESLRLFLPRLRILLNRNEKAGNMLISACA